MISYKYFLKKIKDVKFADYLAVVPMSAGLLLSPLFRKKYDKTWLLCEEKNEARDNGYHFFKYLCENQPQQDCYYAIARGCADQKKVSALGKTVDYGSIKHWILYFTTQYNISSQKGGKPNAALCSFFELNGLFKPRNVFLQHGIILNRLDWIMSDRCCFDYFVTSMKSEYEFVKSAFGYPPRRIHYTGLPRFDHLHDGVIAKNRIIIMPTWRKWLKSKSEQNGILEEDLAESDFWKGWKTFLASDELNKLIDRYSLDILFYPHRAMQPYIHLFQDVNDKITVASMDAYEIQDLIKSAQLMITDYSSVCFDMFYMKKPVIFYQFDEQDFRKYHYEKGWFDYHDNPFANSYKDYREVINAVENLVKQNYHVSDGFLKAHKQEFTLYDSSNSERIYQELSSEMKALG